MSMPPTDSRSAGRIAFPTGYAPPERNRPPHFQNPVISALMEFEFQELSSGFRSSCQMREGLDRGAVECVNVIQNHKDCLTNTAGTTMARSVYPAERQPSLVLCWSVPRGPAGKLLATATRYLVPMLRAEPILEITDAQAKPLVHVNECRHDQPQTRSERNSAFSGPCSRHRRRSKRQ